MRQQKLFYFQFFPSCITLRFAVLWRLQIIKLSILSELHPERCPARPVRQRAALLSILSELHPAPRNRWMFCDCCYLSILSELHQGISFVSRTTLILSFQFFLSCILLQIARRLASMGYLSILSELHQVARRGASRHECAFQFFLSCIQIHGWETYTCRVSFNSFWVASRSWD